MYRRPSLFAGLVFADLIICGLLFDIWCQFHQYFTRSIYSRGSQKRKKIQLSHKDFFTLSGSMSVKAVHRTLIKIDTWFCHQSTFLPVIRRFWRNSQKKINILPDFTKFDGILKQTDNSII